MAYLTQRWPVRAGGRSWLIAAAICVALLAAVGFLDAGLSGFGRGLPAPTVEVFGWITRLGDSDWILYPSLALLVVSVLLALAIPRPPARTALWEVSAVWAFIFAGVGTPSLFTTIVKRMIGRSRPEHLEAVGAFDFHTMSWLDWTYQSFPSGHTTTGFALCFVAGFLFPRSFPWMLALAVLIGLSRVVVGAHYPTDVIGGAVVGIVGAYAVRNVFAWRGWGFQRLDDGTIVRRPMTGIRQVLGRR